MKLELNHHLRVAQTSKSARLWVSKPALLAFTLIEVMIATTIFFMAMFAILGVLSAGIHAATILRNTGPTAGMVAGIYYATNKIEEGSDSGDFNDIAGYEGYKWVCDAREITNGLFKMDFVVLDPHGVQCSTLRDVLFYKSGSGSSTKMGLQQQR